VLGRTLGGGRDLNRPPHKRGRPARPFGTRTSTPTAFVVTIEPARAVPTMPDDEDRTFKTSPCR
jgi:hypothetical protein